MYLEKLEIQGFKSFANRNKLIFPGMINKTKRGITAIVGPNGSGKSNVADAVRWALGEQSMKTLRGRKSEDVIFSGSDKKGKLGMAEVSLFLNNQDKKAPIDYEEVVLTRRLYRNGDSEYLINDSRVRLADIQMLLAKASFGQKTYSVIGQGMVEGFLNTSLAERKEFFDEATGVKQFQIKRDESLNKLRGSYENLNQANMLLSEIEPRVNSLTRQVNKLRKRGELEEELKQKQVSYYRKLWHQNNDKFNKYNNEYVELERAKITKDKKLANLNAELSQLENQKGTNKEFDDLQHKLSELQSKKNEINSQIARLDAQMEVSLDAQGKFDISWMISKKNEISEEIQKINDELKQIQKKDNKESLNSLLAQKNEIDKKINLLNKKILEASEEATVKDKIKEINKILRGLVEDFSKLEKENDVQKIKESIKEVKNEIKKLILGSDEESFKEDLATSQQELIKLNSQKEDLISKINDYNLKNSSQKERLSLLQDRKEGLIKELKRLEDKIANSTSVAADKDLINKKNELGEALFPIEKEINEVKEKINNISQQEEEARRKLFSLQRSLQSLQEEINSLSNQLNEIKINSARFETKLEDLESEIRYNLGGLKEVKEKREEEDIDEAATRERINSLKRQLELIGGIDPEVEREYKETKERYDFLSGQVDDLEKTISSLEKIIKELDATIKEKFDKEFKLIQDKFQEYFKILFNGGSAKIIKVMESSSEDKNKKEEDDSLVDLEQEKKKEDGKMDIKKIKFLQKHNATGLAGIEIQATPPGKKIKSVSMLSGGERALTAIAMICAIISANPSPFVVLDEVDAALDEANSERLAKILDDLSHKTQFIVITHNRATMRKASVLYGVTMGDDSASRLLSVKLEDQNL